jgi:hypothetical protein
LCPLRVSPGAMPAACTNSTPEALGCDEKCLVGMADILLAGNGLREYVPAWCKLGELPHVDSFVVAIESGNQRLELGNCGPE